MKRYLVIGATSAIAQACCRRWLVKQQDGGGASPVEFFLVGRSAEKLEQVAADLLGRGAQTAHWKAVDLNEMASQPRFLEEAQAALGTIDVALIAHGTLPDQKHCETDADTAVREFWINAVVTIALLTRVADIFAAQGSGVIAVITSVAGDRGRPSNYLYGSAKAAVSTFCEGLRARLCRQGVHVMDIRPGFVDTPMTKGLKLPGLLVSTPDRVARLIAAGIDRKKNVLYVPKYWALILWIIRSIPTPIFKRLSL